MAVIICENKFAHELLLLIKVFSGEAQKDLLFPCMSDVKSKFQSGYEREDLSFVENLFEQKDFQDATKVSVQLCR